jgi:hypothetical protein
MFMGALATRDDPFESADNKTLLAFADGHPALEYLISSGFEWPIVLARNGVGPLEDPPEVTESPIHVLGYRVGKSGLAATERRKILKASFQGKLPRVESDRYMRAWGQPRTRDRLRRMARHIAWLARLWGNQQSHTVATSHWREDLSWLRDEFYEPWMRFRWPEVDV